MSDETRLTRRSVLKAGAAAAATVAAGSVPLSAFTLPPGGPRTLTRDQYAVVDGSTHVNASCQNPTWTIMALAWRSCEYLADQLKKGNL